MPLNSTVSPRSDFDASASFTIDNQRYGASYRVGCKAGVPQFCELSELRLFGMAGPVLPLAHMSGELINSIESKLLAGYLSGAAPAGASDQASQPRGGVQS
jgi:hypothetical protein